MLAQSELYVEKYAGNDGAVIDIGNDMTELAFAILSETLFSGEIATETDNFADDVDDLLHTMGRVDPMDLLRAPGWVPRVTRIGGTKVMAKFRGIVRDTMELRRKRMEQEGDAAPSDFLTLLLRVAGPDGLTIEEVEDNILTFIGAGHETTARALAWTLYCVANSPHVREAMEEEIDRVLASGAEPIDWLDLMPWTRAAFEEALRLYPPAPSINRAAIADDSWTSPEGEKYYAYWDVTSVDRPAGFTFKDGFALDETFAPNTEMPESSQVYDFAGTDTGTRATFVATYSSAEALQQVLDMGVVEGSTLAINQIDELLAS